MEKSYARRMGEKMTLIEKLDAICNEIYERWDTDMRSGKLLSALAGHLPSTYRAECADIRRALAAHEWHPIETTPKDGTPFLAWCPIVVGLGDTDATPDAEIQILWWESRGQFTSDRDLGDEHFTHWMPLPEPPK